MVKNLTVWFDKEADFLELSFGHKKKGFFREVRDDVFERVDTKGDIIGFAILNFLKRDKKEQTVLLPVDVIIKKLRKTKSSF